MTKTKPRFTWRAAYDGSEEQAGIDAMTFCPEDSLTQQSFAEDADLNVIVKRFGVDKAVLPPLAEDPRYFGDFTNVPDLRTALDLVRDAQNRFMDLDVKIRNRFDNNPAKLWHWVNDPDNGPEAVRLGLLRAPEPAAATPAAEKNGSGIPEPKNDTP